MQICNHGILLNGTVWLNQDGSLGPPVIGLLKSRDSPRTNPGNQIDVHNGPASLPFSGVDDCASIFLTSQPWLNALQADLPLQPPFTAFINMWYPRAAWVIFVALVAIPTALGNISSTSALSALPDCAVRSHLPLLAQNPLG